MATFAAPPPCCTPVHAVIVAAGAVPDRSSLDAAWPGWLDECQLVVAADGGLRAAELLQLPVDLLVGDADSLPAETLGALRERGTPVEVWPEAKDASDSELALRAAAARGCTRVTCIAALAGERLDHELANVGLLWLAARLDMRAVLLDEAVRIQLLISKDGAGAPRVTCPLAGRTGDLVTLLAFGAPAEGVVTDGLLYPLRDEPLEPGSTRGLSNVRCTDRATVSLRRGSLLIIETTGGRT